MAVWTPDGIRAYMRDTHTAILNANQTFSAHWNQTNARFRRGWARYMNSWSEFYRDNSNTFDLLWGSTVDSVERYNLMLRDWIRIFRRLAPDAAEEIPVPQVSANPNRDSELRMIGDVGQTVMIGALVIGGIFLLSKAGD